LLRLFPRKKVWIKNTFIECFPKNARTMLIGFNGITNSTQNNITTSGKIQKWNSQNDSIGTFSYIMKRNTISNISRVALHAFNILFPLVSLYNFSKQE
jgi:hypothetical protein